MARVTVYVPDEMKVRMDAAGELVNWSAEAQAAFDLALKHVEWRSNMTGIDAAVARLKASKEEHGQEERNAGREAGRSWALESADYKELKAVAAVQKDWRGEVSMADRIAMAACASDEREAHSWWEEAAGEDVEITDDFAEGFQEGAAEVWAEVADQL